ncbi:hypothetical protein QUA35_22900 [Microcoleus sp. N9_B2]|uniref:hypothetical protein n=1 Tax=unclassified Microcoleus TaxID=2642155 RepID=UPI002FD5A6C3
MEVSFSSSFKRAFKKRIKGDADLEARFWQKLEQFIREPFELRYGTIFNKLYEQAFRPVPQENSLFVEQAGKPVADNDAISQFEPSLKTHKLSGRLKEFWSFSVDCDERVLFYFTEDAKAVFVDFGSHDEVY